MNSNINQFQINTDNTSENTPLKACRSLCILLILYMIFNRLFIKVYYYVVYIAAKGSFTLNYKQVKLYLISRKDIINSTYFNMGGNIFTTALSIFFMLLFAKTVMNISVKSYMKTDRKSFKYGCIWIPACFVINMIFTSVSDILTSIINSSGITVPTTDFTISDPSKASILTQLAYSIILAPIFEELIYRGLPLKILAPCSKKAAVIFSALSFGLMHGNIPQAVSAAASGFFYAVIAVRCGSVIPTIIIHIVNNIIASIPDFAKVLDISNYTVFYSIMIISVGLIGFYVIFDRWNDIYKFDKHETIQNIQNRKLIFTDISSLIYFGILIFAIIQKFFDIN